jgi:hypothetical protein
MLFVDLAQNGLPIRLPTAVSSAERESQVVFIDDSGEVVAELQRADVLVISPVDEIAAAREEVDLPF